MFFFSDVTDGWLITDVLAFFFVVSEKAQYNIRSHLVVVVQRSTFDKDRKKNRRDGETS